MTGSCMSNKANFVAPSGGLEGVAAAPTGTIGNSGMVRLFLRQAGRPELPWGEASG